MRISGTDLRYEWIDNWASMPTDPLAGTGWAHHDVVVTRERRLMTFQSGGDEVCTFDRSGELVGRWHSGLIEAHGMTLTGGDQAQRLWIADPGKKMWPEAGGGYEPRVVGPHGRVVLFALDGSVVGDLPTPPTEAYERDRYCPTAVAVDDGPDGDDSIWVADGYGQSLVHRFSSDGVLQQTLTGEEGAGRFDCPHSIFIDHRTERPRLYVTDRANGRIQVYDMQGRFLHAISSGLRSPSALATYGEYLVVAELHARLSILDAHDRLVAYLGDGESDSDRAGWPNALASDGRVVRPDELRVGRFNSPHGIAIDPRGDLYVAEWLIGGRLTRLRREH